MPWTLNLESSPHLQVLLQASRIKALPDLLLPGWQHLCEWQEACMPRAAVIACGSPSGTPWERPQSYRGQSLTSLTGLLSPATTLTRQGGMPHRPQHIHCQLYMIVPSYPHFRIQHVS